MRELNEHVKNSIVYFAHALATARSIDGAEGVVRFLEEGMEQLESTEYGGEAMMSQLVAESQAMGLYDDPPTPDDLPLGGAYV